MAINSDLHIEHYKPNWKITIYAKNLDKPIVLDRKYIQESTNDIIKVSTQKQINQVGTFSISFVARESKTDPEREESLLHELMSEWFNLDDDISNWYEKLSPNDLVVIQLGRDKSQAIEGDLKNPYIVFIGLISKVSKSLTFGGDMKPKRQITIEGMDLGKMLLHTSVYKNDFATAWKDLVQTIQIPNDNFNYPSDSPININTFLNMLLSAVVPTKITTVKMAVERVLGYFYTLRPSLGLQVFNQPIQNLLKYDVDAFKLDNGKEPEIQYFMALSPFMLTIWDLLLKYAVPQPYNEIILRESKEKVETTLLVRGIDKYLDYNTFGLKDSANKTKTHKLSENDLGIATYDLSRSDEQAYSIWTMSPISPTAGSLDIGNLTIQGMAWCPANMAKYGYKIFQNTSNYYIYPGEQATALTLPQDTVRSIAKLTALLPEQEQGSLIVKGNSDFQIGDILEITYNHKQQKMRYYIYGVQHDFTPFYGSWITILTVTRGTKV